MLNVNFVNKNFFKFFDAKINVLLTLLKPKRVFHMAGGQTQRVENIKMRRRNLKKKLNMRKNLIKFYDLKYY